MNTTALPMLTGERAMELWAKANPGMQQSPSSRYLRDFAHAVLQEYAPCFAQREREAERAAINVSIAHFCTPTTREFQRWLDKHFPSLISSQEITLSSSDVFRRVEGHWQWKVKNIESWLDSWVDTTPPVCHTAADHDKCATILREEEQ